MKLHRIPCENCKEDTLHIALVCNQCGTTFKTPSETGRAFRKRVWIAQNLKGPIAERMAKSSARRADLKALDKQKKDTLIGPTLAPIGNHSVYGSGRDRKRV